MKFSEGIFIQIITLINQKGRGGKNYSKTINKYYKLKYFLKKEGFLKFMYFLYGEDSK